MRSIFTFTITLLILTACSQTPTSVISTPLPSMTPTHISTVTPTVLPAITSSPTPPTSDLTLAQQAELDTLNKTLDGAYKIDTYKDGEKVYATITDAKTGETIPEIRIDANDPEHLSWSKVYEYRGHTIVIPELMDKITVGADGKIEFNFPGYEWKDGKFEPLVVEGQPVKNVAEAQVDMIMDGDITHTLLTLDETHESSSFQIVTGGAYFKFGELRFQLTGLFWRANALKILNSDGTVSDITTTGYGLYNSKDAKYPYQVLFFMGKDKQVHSILVDSLDIGWKNTKAWGEWGNYPEN